MLLGYLRQGKCRILQQEKQFQRLQLLPSDSNGILRRFALCLYRMYCIQRVNLHLFQLACRRAAVKLWPLPEI